MLNKCNTISENCKDCCHHDHGYCYYGPKILVSIFGPMRVPKTGWCNRFDNKIKKDMVMAIQKTDNMKLTKEQKACRNCVGFRDCACYRRPWILLYLFGPLFVGPGDKCWKFKNKHMAQNTRSR